MRGFSLVEVIVTIAIFAILVALGLFMSFEAYRSTTRRSERETIVSMLERARSRALANIGETSWSVCYDAGNYLIAKGSTCNDSVAYDRVEANPVVVADSDFLGFPIEFAQVTGTVAGAPKTVTVTQNGKDEEIEVNHEGRINW